jgi:hypothetical protein
VNSNNKVLNVGSLDVADLSLDHVILQWYGTLPEHPSEGSFTTFTRVEFLNYSTTDIFMEVKHKGSGGPFAFVDMAYNTRPTGDSNSNRTADPGEGFYLRAEDLNSSVDGLLEIDWDVLSGPGCDFSEIVGENGAVVDDVGFFCS